MSNNAKVNNYRFTVYIYFEEGNYIKEDVKTLREARSYKGMIDETVKKAGIIDKINKKIVELWKS